MDELIYTLLFIGWIAYGIFSAVKKNKAKANSSSATQAPSEAKSKVESVFESLFQENSQNYSEVNSPYYKSAPVDASEEPAHYEDEYNEYEEYEEPDYLDTVPEKSTVSKIDTYSGTDSAVSSLLVDQEEDELEGDELADEKDDFDLRQAIIAQAVLDRPYE